MSDIQKVLDEPIPRDVVSYRPGGNGKELSYLETWYVIDRMNQVFGTEKWSQEIKELKLLSDSPASYMAIVRIQLAVGNTYGTCKEGVGYGSDKPNRQGEVKNPHELAMKEAVSDAFKTAAKNLGRSMGLALYDKSQEYVIDSQPTSRTSVPNVAVSDNTKQRVSTKSDPKSLIKATFGVLQAQKKITSKDFAIKVLGSDPRKVEALDSNVLLEAIFKKILGLTDDSATQILNSLKTNYKELNL